ncbi:exported hypothetical protein [Agrobacterium deltaense Zutra 3/1]|uniref:Uncharacterized protein n=2 Tax=Rhizobium/Agrobacterium group TaxID=227290 RepID=A0A1S7QMM0_9HYPH|nr:exported hypothetical protein [Agrobacterium deltaense Zutra 3/1]
MISRESHLKTQQHRDCKMHMKPAVVFSWCAAILAATPTYALNDQQDHFGSAVVRTVIGGNTDAPPMQNGALIAFKIDLPTDRIEYIADGLHRFSFGCENHGEKFYFTLYRRTRGLSPTVPGAVTISTASSSITGEAQVASGMVGSLDFPDVLKLLQALAKSPSDIRFDVDGEIYNFPTHEVPSEIYARILKQCSLPNS